MVISIQLSIVLVFLFIINMYLIVHKRYDYVFSLLIILLTFISKETNGLISGVPYDNGGAINISLAGYDVIIILIISCILREGKYKVPRRIWTVVSINLLLVFFIRIVVDWENFLSNKIFDNYLLPICLYFLICKHLNKKDMVKVIAILYSCILINSFIACIEYFLGRSLFFHDYYMESVTWYPSVYLAQQYGNPFRSIALLGHPLTNCMYYLIGVVYLCNNSKKWNYNKWIQLFVLVFGIFTTNSRGAILVLSLYIFYYALSNKKAISLCCLTGVGAFCAMVFNLDRIYSDVFARDITGGSLLVRVNAILNFRYISFFNILFGVGFNNSGTIFSRYTGGANAEISYLILLVENGIIGFVFLMIAFIAMYNRKMYKRLMDLKFSGLIHGMLFCYLLYGATSNSFGDPGTLVYLLSFILAFSQIGKVVTNRERTRYEFVLASEKSSTKLPI